MTIERNFFSLLGSKQHAVQNANIACIYFVEDQIYFAMVIGEILSAKSDVSGLKENVFFWQFFLVGK